MNYPPFKLMYSLFLPQRLITHCLISVFSTILSSNSLNVRLIRSKKSLFRVLPMSRGRGRSGIQPGNNQFNSDFRQVHDVVIIVHLLASPMIAKWSYRRKLGMKE